MGKLNLREAKDKKKLFRNLFSTYLTLEADLFEVFLPPYKFLGDDIRNDLMLSLDKLKQSIDKIDKL